LRLRAASGIGLLLLGAGVAAAQSGGAPELSELRERPETPAPVARVLRPADARPRHDDRRASELGIQRYESTHLLLYTDVPEEQARTIPPLVDQLYPVWEEYLGPLPMAPDGARFQMTGYLIRERDRFEAAGMLPPEQLSFQHGKHRGAEFWVEDQPFDYYRRHLVLHEATHCYMTITPGPRPPVWCLEGLAELFAVHRITATGAVEFAALPASADEVPGFGRIRLLQQQTALGQALDLRQVMQLGPREFADQSTGPYAWSWALCLFLDRHPRSRERFRAACLRCSTGDFFPVLEQSFSDDAAALWIDWEQFLLHIQFGYDFERAAIEYRPGTPLAPGESREVNVASDRGWQSTGVRVDSHAVYELSADGQVSLAEAPRPWISEPAGVSIRFSEGRPIGQLLGAVQAPEPPTPEGEGSLRRVLELGPEAELTPVVAGTLYVRVNDFWSELADNAGSYRLVIRRRP
jgi:hypothetical protein